MIWEFITSNIPFFTLIILFLTFLAVIYYALETKKLRIETFKQRELSLRPFVIVTWEPPGKYFIQNLGNGAALRIQVDDIVIPNDESWFKFHYTFPVVDVMVPGNKSELDIRDNEGNPAKPFDFGVLQAKDFDFKIRYSNIEKKPYHTVGKIGKDGVIIEGTG